jgi:hypothetical protein
MMAPRALAAALLVGCARAAVAPARPGAEFTRDGAVAARTAAPPAPAAAPLPPLGDPVFTLLTLGVPIVAYVGFNAYAYFQFNVSRNLLASNASLWALVTGLDGNPDLYATLNGDTPSTTRSDYTSASWGFVATEDVQLKGTDAAVGAYCAPLWAANPNATCPLRLAVLGARPGNFSVVIESSAAGLDVVTVVDTSPSVATFAPGSSVLLAATFDAAGAGAGATGFNMALTGFNAPLAVLWGSSALGDKPRPGVPST